MRKQLGLAALLLLAASPAGAEGLPSRATYMDTSLPAVSGLNGKLEAFGGEFADESLAAVAGSISFPLARRYGVQIDGLVGSSGGDNIAGVGAHLFWRDPARGLAGVYGDHVHWDGFGGNSVSRLAAEGELYLGRVSLEGMIGAEFGELNDRVFARSNIAYYPRDDVRLFVGHRYLGGEHALALGAEWQVAPRGVALFAEGQVGDDTGSAILGGLRIYFGDRDKSLIRRHREDDPVNDLKNASQSLVGNLTHVAPCVVGVSAKQAGPSPCNPN
jgi:hypothetical protein